MSNATFYRELAQTATDLLTEFGDEAILRRGVTGAVYDPATGTTSGTTPVDEAIMAAVFDINEMLIDGSTIQRGDKTAYVSVANALGEPQATDRFVWQDEIYSIIAHKELAPAGINVLFEWQVRK